MATRDKPLKIKIYTAGTYVIVSNNIQKMAVRLKSSETGLKNLTERVRLVTGRTLIIEETADAFTVKVPLIS
jgi:two-component system, LytTR family, sensor kinase